MDLGLGPREREIGRITADLYHRVRESNSPIGGYHNCPWQLTSRSLIFYKEYEYSSIIAPLGYEGAFTKSRDLC